MSLSSLELQRAHIWRVMWRAIRSAWMRHLRRRRVRRDLGQLLALDDFSLRDIGVSRCEIRAAIREGTDLGSLRH